MRTRQHWVVLLKGNALYFVLLAGAMLWLYFNPRFLVNAIHLHQSDPWFGFVRFFYDRGLGLSLLPIIGAGISFFLTWSWWTLSFFQIDSEFLTYEIVPFMKNQIPIRAIQDIRMERPGLGLFLGYGTIVVDAGRQEESLYYVPQVTRFVELIGGRTWGMERR